MRVQKKDVIAVIDQQSFVVILLCLLAISCNCAGSGSEMGLGQN
jgi:hypothetical protein